MNPLSDGWRVLWQDSGPVFAVSAFMLWGSILTVAVLRGISGDSYRPTEYLSLIMGGWIVPVFLISIAIYIAGVLLGAPPGVQVAGVFMAVVTGWPVLRKGFAGTGPLRGSVWSLLTLTGILLISVLLRLAFVAKIALPLYFDSAEHYWIIQRLMDDMGGPAPLHGLAWPTVSYYHLGFHLILAAMTFISQQELSSMMLVAGQIVLAGIPISLFLIVERATRSEIAGLLCVLLGALGWYMPAQAANWGKYPALFSLPVVLFVLNAAYLAGEAGAGSRKRSGLMLLAFLAGSAAFLIHTRSIVLIGIAAVAWALAKLWADRPQPQRMLFLGLAVFILTVQGILISRSTILAPLLDPYLRSGFWVTSLVALFSLPAVQKYPRLAFSSLLSILLLFACLFIAVPDYAFSPLLDRPLVEMVIFIPLAVLGTTGIAGAAEHVKDASGFIRAGAMAGLSIALAVHAFGSYGFYPSSCCSLVKGDDLVALDWTSKNLPADARVLVASAQIQFAPSPYPAQDVAGDAGFWLTPLTGIQTVARPYWMDFGQLAVLDWLCQQGVSDVYVGATSQSFRMESLVGRPEWYGISLFLPGTKIYHVIGCKT